MTAARGVLDRLTAAGIRAHLDDRSETLNYRIREGEIWKVPYMAIVGQREAESDSLALRARGVGKKQEVMTVDAFVARVRRKCGPGRRALPTRRTPANLPTAFTRTDLRDRFSNSRHSLRRPYANRTLSRRAFDLQRPAARRHGHSRCRRARQNRRGGGGRSDHGAGGAGWQRTGSGTPGAHSCRFAAGYSRAHDQQGLRIGAQGGHAGLAGDQGGRLGMRSGRRTRGDVERATLRLRHACRHQGRQPDHGRRNDP